MGFEYEPKTFEYVRPVRGARCDKCDAKSCSVLRKYTPDLRIAGFYVEIKGKFTGENRAKMEDFLRGHPEVDLRFLFQRDNWLTGKHKSRYSDWARRLGVKWAVGTKVPEEWLRGIS